MNTREVSGEKDNSGSGGKTAWDTLKEVPFGLYKAIKKDQERKQIREQRDEEQRQRKLNEWVGKISADPYAKKHEDNEMERRAHESAISYERTSKENMIRDMANGREEAERTRAKHYEKERVQELIERDFNSILTSEEKLQESIEFGDDRIEEGAVDYQGEEITVYDLKGLPFSLLVHDMNFRGDPNHPAHWLSQNNIEDPSNWAKNIEEAKQSDTWGSASGEGNTISTSFLSPMTLETGDKDSPLLYGFSHVDAGSIKTIAPYDAATGNMKDDDSIGLEIGEVDAVRARAALEEKQTVYDEIQISRYSETGEPKRPDYIVVRNGKITDTVLKHAAFWKIPIVSIDKAAYDNSDSAPLEKNAA